MAQAQTEPGRVTVDMALGAVVFGIVGATIGYSLNIGVSLIMPLGVGVVLGSIIGRFGARRFFLSIVCGAVVGGGLAWLVSGSSMVVLGAGSGGAIGGFLGVQMDMLLDLWRQSRQAPSTEPASPVPVNGEHPQ